MTLMPSYITSTCDEKEFPPYLSNGQIYYIYSNKNNITFIIFEKIHSIYYLFPKEQIAYIFRFNLFAVCA